MKIDVKRHFAIILVIAMFLSIISPAHITLATNQSHIIVHYNMTHNNGKLIDVTGNGNNAEMINIKDSDFTSESAGTALNFDATSKYVKIPKGTIQGESFTIEATYKTSNKADHWLWTLGTTVASWPNVKNYLFVNPLSSQSGYVGKILGGIKNANTELRSNPLSPNPSELNTVVAVFNNGDLTIYLNGTPAATINSGYSIQSILNANSPADCIGYIGRSLYSADPYYKGSLYDFKVYNTALTESQIKSNYDVNQETYLQLAKENLTLNGIDDVNGDLTLPTTGLYNSQITWESSDFSVITNTGVVTKQNVDTTVTLTATISLGSANVKKIFTANVKSDSGILNLEKENLIVNNIDDVRGNLTLPTTGKYNTNITWKSSNSDIITDTASGDIPAGVVKRQSSDTTVTLTATIKLGSASLDKTFTAKVKAKEATITTNGYMFAYFIGQNGPNEEQLYFASSLDGLKWNELNGGNPVLTSNLGEKGVRDPFIIRSPEGDKFYLIATDLSIYYDGNWSRAQTSGSQSIMVWESTDLVNWSNQRMVKIASNDAGCTWAPEAFYDESTGEYIVFWASKVGEDNYAKQRVYYSKTRDFYTFTEPQVWLQEDYSVIDCTVIKDEVTGYYYRFTKNESKTYIYLERSTSLMSSFEKVGSWKNISGAEGPTAYKLNGKDEWILLVDYFGAGGYFPYSIKDFSNPVYTKLEDGTYSLPSKPRHGTVMPITTEEYNRIMSAYGEVTADLSSVPDAVMQNDDASAFPSSVNFGISGLEETKKAYEIDWNITKDTFSKVGLVTVTGTVKSLSNKTISKQILVVRRNTKYFVDSATDILNKESPYYNFVANKESLLNSKPDQQYDGKWGYTSYDWYKSETNLAINNSGFYGKNDGSVNPTYKVTLNSGKYILDSMQYEWWNGPRTTEVHALYTDSNGNAKDVILGDSTVKSSSRVGMTSGEFTIDKDNTEVTIIFKRTSGDGAVVSYFSIAEASKITGIESLLDIDVVSGTDKDSLGLPNNVSITIDGATTTNAAVIWNDGNPTYNSDILGTYQFTGEVSLDSGINNPNNLKAIVNVKVREVDNDNLSKITYKNVPDGAYDFSKKLEKGLDSIKPDNDIEEDDILDSVRPYVEKTTDSAVEISMEDYSMDKATYEKDGNITGKIVIDCDNYKSDYEFKLNIPKINSDWSYDFTETVNKGLDSITANNDIEEDDILDAVRPYVEKTTSSAVELSMEDYNMDKATYEKDGNITGKIVINCDDYESSYEFNLKIAILEDSNEVDKSKLIEFYNAYKNKTQGRYTSYTWDIFVSALNNAEEKINKEDASEEEIEKAYNELKSAVEGLKTKSSSSHSSSSSSSSNKNSENQNTSDNNQAIPSESNKDTVKNTTKPEWGLIDGKWYMLDKTNGTKITGWYNDNGSWYYLDEDGSMATDWIKDKNGLWYYLNANGSMATGWLLDKDGVWYYLNNSGAMEIGWLKDNYGKWYYLKENGAMAHNEYMDGYYLDSNGAWIELV